jgi:hypothetical protein
MQRNGYNPVFDKGNIFPDQRSVPLCGWPYKPPGGFVDKHPRLLFLLFGFRKRGSLLVALMMVLSTNENHDEFFLDNLFGYDGLGI